MGTVARAGANSDTRTGVVAAGALVVRGGGEVLLVHRPKYDDWTFPKGKQELGEHVCATAVREVLEETGLKIALGRPLARQCYRLADGRTKTVHYWVARPLGAGDIDGYEPNHEVDRVAWFPRAKARRRLSYAMDADLLEELISARTRTLVVLRHGKAVARTRWRKSDQLRPLTGKGSRQARLLVPVLAAYGIDTMVSSDSVRCMRTLAPYAEAQRSVVEQRCALNEEDWTDKALADLVEELFDHRTAVVCTHRPVLPAVFEQLGITERPLATAELVVVHHRKGKVVATERHRAL